MRVRVERADAEPSEFVFADAFRIGRGMECEVWIDSTLVSRVHAEVVFEEGGWWVRDLESTNGIYLDGQKVQQARLDDEATLQLGHNAPVLHISIDPSDVRSEKPARRVPVRPGVSQPPMKHPSSKHPASPDLWPPIPGAPGSSSPDPSISRVIDRYFDEDSQQPAGERTRMIRRAYAAVKKKQKRKYTWVIAGVLVLFLAALGYGVMQKKQNQQLQALAQNLFYRIQSLNVSMADLQRAIEEEGGAALRDQLERIEAERQRLLDDYEGYVVELGFYRKLRDGEERLIYQTARIFNESEFGIKATFVRAVKEEIRTYWQGAGKSRFEQAVRRAEENGYTPYIVQTLQRYRLPPEFFYLALQESDFNAEAIGPPTRWGRAKGMWQFIPATAQRYDLDPGPLVQTGARDPNDDREDFRLATVAAARYLRDIHGMLTQSSGLLAMASYNWGEHRVSPRVEGLNPETPQQAFAATFEDVPRDPEARNYWRFLEAYEDRIPEQTRDYVLKIFAAAVVGQDPRRFGFDFDNPLEPYMEASPSPGN